MLQLVRLVALSLLAVPAEADEVCESTLLQAHRGRLEEASPSPGITINSTEAEAVTSCPEGADCEAAGNGGCIFWQMEACQRLPMCLCLPATLQCRRGLLLSRLEVEQVRLQSKSDVPELPCA